MGGLLFFAVIIAWFGLCVWLARKIVGWLPIESVVAKFFVSVLVFAAIFPVPLIDEIIGKFQFDKLCREEAGVKIYGKLELGPEFFNADGKPNFEVSRGQLDERMERIVELSPFTFERIRSPVDLGRGTFRIFDRRNGKELARIIGFNNRGGWLAFDHTSSLSNSPCYPPKSEIDVLKTIATQTPKEHLQ